MSTLHTRFVERSQQRRRTASLRLHAREHTQRTRSEAVGCWAVVGLAVLFLVVVVVHLEWVDRFRRGNLLDIDEAGYLGFALDDLRGWHVAGLSGLRTAAVAHGPFAPLLPLVSMPFLSLFGHAPATGMGAQLVFLALLTLAVFGLGEALAGRVAGASAAAIVLLAPGVFDFTRTFHFVLPSTSCLAAAVCCLVRSRHLQARGWTILGGAATGSLLLSRTYAVAFIPALGIALLIVLLTRKPSQRARAWQNVGLAALTTVIVAAWWWVPNASKAFTYLTSYGYGGKSSQYTQGVRSPFVLGFWTTRLSQLASEGLYLLGTLVLLAISLLYVGSALSTARAEQANPAMIAHRLSRWLTSPAGSVATVLAVSYLVLTSSSNRGTGFVVPLVPLAIVLGVVGALSLRPPWAVILISALFLAVAIPAIGKSSSLEPLATARCLALPLLDCAKVTDGRGVVQEWESALAIDAEASRQWLQAVDHTAVLIHELADDPSTSAPIVFFASRDPVFNTNTVGLNWREKYIEPLAVGQLAPDQSGDNTVDYLLRLVRPKFGQPTLLIATDRGKYEYRPKVTQARAERAARCIGFTLQANFPLPDGRSVRLYQRTAALPTRLSRSAAVALLRDCREERPAP